MNPDGSCSHLYEIGEKDRDAIMKRYRKVMGWAVSVDMRTDAYIRDGHLVSYKMLRCSLYRRRRRPT